MWWWNKVIKKKPKKSGWYICTVEVPGQQRYVMDLWYNNSTGRWLDNRRQQIFNDYEVYGYNDETGKNDKRLSTISLCDRTNSVVAWRKLPKTYMKGFVESNEFKD